MYDRMILDPEEVLDAPELHRMHRTDKSDRVLGSNDNYESLLVDKQGNQYESYSLAWRYLGLYMDCEVEDGANDWYNEDQELNIYYNNNNKNRRRRKLPSDDQDDDEGGNCERKVLWAAYVDPRYKGNTIEEYEFYNLETGEWDDSACEASGSRHRCARMDCHEPRTHFKLVGVFKETDGMYDFTEQLFKHEGYCVWGDEDDEDTYETMETWMEKWPTSCTQLQNQDLYGNTLYIHVHPLKEGNMTLEIYTDEICSIVSKYTDLTSYIETLYYNYYGYYDKGTEVAEMYQEAIATWNEKMSTFKVCQPCRAYNLFSENGDQSSGHSNDRRILGSGDDTDGEGEEQERYNCYDDAGYTNVDQCYKFETHTSMEAADSDDLKLASAQGSILRVKATDGKVYGKGGYVSPMSHEQLVTNICLAALVAVGLAASVFFFHRKFEQRKRAKAPKSMKEAFDINVDSTEAGESGTKDVDVTYDSSDSDDTSADENGNIGARDIEMSDVTYTPPAELGLTSPSETAQIKTETEMLGMKSAFGSDILGPAFLTELAPMNDTVVLLDLGLIDRYQKPPTLSSFRSRNTLNDVSVSSTSPANTVLSANTKTIVESSLGASKPMKQADGENCMLYNEGDLSDCVNPKNDREIATETVTDAISPSSNSEICTSQKSAIETNNEMSETGDAFQVESDGEHCMDLNNDRETSTNPINLSSNDGISTIETNDDMSETGDTLRVESDGENCTTPNNERETATDTIDSSNNAHISTIETNNEMSQAGDILKVEKAEFC